LEDSDSGGASAVGGSGVYGDYSSGGAWAGGASEEAYLGSDARYSGLGANGNGGLLGTYFDSPFLEPGTEAFTRVDPLVNFTWGLGRLTTHATDFVSVRWAGAVRPPRSASSTASGVVEDYTFMVVCDEGVRLWVDHELIIDQWHARLDGRNVSGTIGLTPGRLHRIILEYREVWRDAFVRLLWASARDERRRRHRRRVRPTLGGQYTHLSLSQPPPPFFLRVVFAYRVEALLPLFQPRIPLFALAVCTDRASSGAFSLVRARRHGSARLAPRLPRPRLSRRCVWGVWRRLLRPRAGRVL
jgi:hypothetical protein